MTIGRFTAAADPVDLGANDIATVAGFQFNLDTIAATVSAGLIVTALGLWARRGLSSARPGRLALAWETLIGAAERHLGGRTGGAGRQIVPLAVALFTFILTASLLETIPSGHPDKALPAPTGDLNLTIALALFVAVAVHATAIRARGWRGYLRHYLTPTPWLLPLKLLEEMVRPLTLALRLFGNIFAGTVIVVLIFELIPPTIAPLPLLAWKLFSVFAAGMQAFIFALLTVLYFDATVGSDTAVLQPNDPPPAGTLTTGGNNP